MNSATQIKRLVPTLKPGRGWLVLFAGPVLFFIGLVLASTYFSIATQGDIDALHGLVAASTPYQLVAIQSCFSSSYAGR